MFAAFLRRGNKDFGLEVVAKGIREMVNSVDRVEGQSRRGVGVDGAVCRIIIKDAVCS